MVASKIVIYDDSINKNLTSKLLLVLAIRYAAIRLKISQPVNIRIEINYKL